MRRTQEKRSRKLCKGVVEVLNEALESKLASFSSFKQFTDEVANLTIKVTQIDFDRQLSSYSHSSSRSIMNMPVVCRGTST